MAAMKQQHLSIVLEMEEQYKGMEADMQVCGQAFFSQYVARANTYALSSHLVLAWSRYVMMHI